jgi:hypothetical protein
MADIRHKLEIEADQAIVYENLTSQIGLSGWWTPETQAKPEVNSVLRFGFGSRYFKEMKAVELIPEKKVVWKCITGTEEWIGTIVQFDLQKDDKKTQMYFSHNGWEQQTPMFSQCSYDWAMFLRSLKKLSETGKGLPFPNQHQ